jgi:colanic acid/amylovoran biosynthesis glycosyltransferase
MKVGLVLSRPPGYSETFFRSKINGLIRNNIQMKLFVDRKDEEFNLCEQVGLPPVWSAGMFFSIISIVLKKPLRVFKFLLTEFGTHKNLRLVFKNFYQSLHLLNEKKLNIIHFGFATNAIGRENVAGIIGAKSSVSFRGYDISRYPLRHPGCYNILWKKINKVHVISQSLHKDAIHLGLPPNVSWKLVTPAVDASRFAVEMQPKNFHTPLRLLTVGRIHWVKGYEYVLEALSLLRSRNISFQYTIVGDGPDHDRIVLASKQLQLDDQIIFAGKVAHETLQLYYSDADIYLQYSLHEGFCNAVLEAQASGLPCVVSNAGGLPENVIHEKTGWVVPSRSPELLSQKITEVMQMDAGEILQIRKNAVDHVTRNFSIAEQEKKFMEFFLN